MVIAKGEIRHGRFRVAYRAYGNAAQTMVCVSGVQQTMAVWRSLIAYFRGQYSIVIFDLPGVGRSRVLSGALEASIDEQVGILNRIIELTRRPGPLTLVGCSWGTMVVAAYAARYPSAVDKLVLASFGVRPSKRMLELIRDGQAFYERGENGKAAELIIDGFGQNISDTYKRQIIEQFKRMSPDQARTFYNHCEFVEGVQDIAEYVALDRITAPTLIINGANDEILDRADLETATTRIRNCQTRVVEDAGHFLHFERPEILDIYAEFLAQ
ncbi:MAG: alpha/beta fold hydrolase [Candidatus Binatia bacterium]